MSWQKTMLESVLALFTATFKWKKKKKIGEHVS